MKPVTKNRNDFNHSGLFSSMSSSIVSSIDTGLCDVLLSLRKIAMLAVLGSLVFMAWIYLSDTVRPSSIAPVLSSDASAVNVWSQTDGDDTGLFLDTWLPYLLAERVRICRDQGGRWRNNRCEFLVQVCQADQTSGGIGYHCTWKWR